MNPRGPAGARANYSYDGNSLRVQKVSGSTTTVYIFSGTKVIAEYQNAVAPANPTREYICSGSQLLAEVEASATQALKDFDRAVADCQAQFGYPNVP